MTGVPRDGLVLLTGASGFVGGRLLRALEADERRVRCLSRRPEALDEATGPTTEAVAGDVLDADSLASALVGCDAAYYLIHSLGSTGSFADEDREAAENFAAAARKAGLQRIVYLGGLGHGDELSDHLASRQEVGRILRESGVPTIEFRASIVVGAGSLSFEMIRSLVDWLPVLVLPGWVETLSQPIGIDDLIRYLVAALDVELDESAIFEIGGADRVSYRELIEEYAEQAGKQRLITSVPLPAPPVSTSDLPAQWLSGLAPETARSAVKLIESLRFETTADDAEARRLFGVSPRGVREAVAEALAAQPA